MYRGFIRNLTREEMMMETCEVAHGSQYVRLYHSEDDIDAMYEDLHEIRGKYDLEDSHHHLD